MTETRPEAYIVDAVRTPTGKKGGGLSALHPADLLGEVFTALLDRTGVDPSTVDDVITGCVAQLGDQAFNVGRNAWLSAGLPVEVPAVTIDRQCGSSQQAVHFAAQAIKAGEQDIVVAGGVESMSRVPLNSSGDPGLGYGYPFAGEGWAEHFGAEEIHQFRGGDLIAERWGIDREAMFDLAIASHANAARAQEEGRFDDQLLPVADVTADEGVRRTADRDKMRGIPPIRDGGFHNAPLASQIADGAAGLLVASERAVNELGLTPLARVHTTTVVGSDPVLILSGPIPATRKVLDRAGLSADDVDLYECNEAFAAVVLAWAKDVGVDLDRVNVNGGAMAIGHPLGASGARLMTTLVHEMRRSGARYGLQTMCEGGGLSNATVLERV
ncbi:MULTISPECIES: acetyl-CoA C-acyltransferase [Prauserella salsuginis group]|uniref:Acetyl-CoA C-acetyltransferase n=2 Tax=Prauserella salsuginis group TaxID=2893672 RepID=A0A839Y0Q6_9PSEU|nr:MULTISPECIES: acetyl-CoA C-acyltransferase [Prauserella salsuginis group]MBB3665535.1 acetyl-CoA C-acetyltransferase [Prauserella sediminis]MCR3718767.1 acetyl-CoA C-acetyltransferase [Prauserella flava]MCR3733337.1 acetyl-CoA C-acetyltransferase [Prauserella salsuginis]